MRRTMVAGTVLAVALALPAGAVADPNVPDAALAQATLTLNADAATLSLDATGRTLDLSQAVVPLEEESSEGARVTVRISADVLFDFNKATLTEAARRRIVQLAPRLRNTTGAVQVSGHSDSVGAPAYNLKLSRERAEAVKAELARALTGTTPRIEAKGFGETKPVAPNQINKKDNPEGRAKNRRVEITFQKT